MSNEADNEPAVVLGSLLEIINHGIDRREEAAFAEGDFAGLTSTQIHYLDAVRHCRDATVTRVAESMGLSKASVTLAVDRLSTAGFLEKKPSPTDRRSSTIVLTPRGRRIVEKHEAVYVDVARRLLSSLPRQSISGFVETLTDIVGALKEGDRS
jgi:DNA-binding MarR family transcriptional regulator